MAAVKHARGVKLLIKVGDGASPEVFTALCTINAARGITFSAATNDILIPDCTDPDLIGWLEREKVSLSAAVTGSGTVNTPDVQDIYDWVTDEDPKNCQIVVDVPSADGGVIFEGAFHCTEAAFTGDQGGKQQGSISLVSSGEVTCVANT